MLRLWGLHRAFFRGLRRGRRHLYSITSSAREQRRGNVEAKQPRSFQIDNEFALGRLQNWKLGGLGIIIARHLPALAEAVTRTFALGEASRLTSLFK
jgi:hypothetical protein